MKLILMIVAYVCVAMVVTAGGYVAGRIHRIFIDPPMEKTDYLPGGGSRVKLHESRATGKE